MGEIYLVWLLNEEEYLLCGFKSIKCVLGFWLSMVCNINVIVYDLLVFVVLMMVKCLVIKLVILILVGMVLFW